MAEIKRAKISVGRRKTSIARVYLLPGSGEVKINGRKVEEYFPVLRMRKHAIDALTVTESSEKYDVHIRVIGGGVSSQSGAVRLGLARALQDADVSRHSPLKHAGMLKRDPRMVERKKYGRHKARRGTQFSKR